MFSAWPLPFRVFPGLLDMPVVCALMACFAMFASCFWQQSAGAVARPGTTETPLPEKRAA
jgi:hypothetical protein